MNAIKMILALLATVSVKAMAADLDVEANGNQTITPEHIDSDVVKHREDLATHLGLSNQDALFGAPRDFRSNSLNELSLEPLNTTEKN